VTEWQKAVFLSYASQDAEAARRICETLRVAGIEVWFDQSELRGGDAWDRKIRQQIKDCALFVPLISAHTEARPEGYFRLEWHLADQRTHLMARTKAFVVPVVVDDTPDASAEVPDSFSSVQWTRLPAGETPSSFCERISTLLVDAHHSSQLPTAVRAGAAMSRRRGRPYWIAAVIAGLLVAATLVLRPWPLITPKLDGIAAASPTPDRDTIATPEQSIAVLPFADMSEKHDQEYFSDGLSEELTDMLTKVAELRVPARRSSFYFKGKNEKLATIARELRVAHVLEGSVRKVGDRLRITAQLVRVDNGYQLWSQTFDRDAHDIFKVQEEISTAVVSALKVKLAVGPQGLSSRGTASADAYTHFLMGQSFFNRYTDEGFQQAIEAYQKAIALDPQYGDAYASKALAEAYVFDAHRNAEDLKRALEDAERGIALAPDSSRVYRYRGWIRLQWLWDWAGAKADFEKARALEPRDSRAEGNYAVLLAYLGNVPQAISETRKLLTIEPLSVDLLVNLTNYQTAIGDFTGAETSARRAIEVEPGDLYLVASLANVLTLQGKPGEALKLCPRLQEDVDRLICVAQAEHGLGHAAESRRATDEAVSRGGTSRPYDVAVVCAWRGDRDKAFAWLEKAYQSRDMGISEIKMDWELRPLRADPRYGALLRKMKLPV
jgi:TolB-like protein/tetratricopeptide (TPR) repeat protein